jgi:fluoride ion exporter CrcB/FEX
MIAIACMVGALLRHIIETLFNKENSFYGTLGINILGSFILGWAIATDAPDYVPAFCGVFTTFGGFIAQAHSIKKVPLKGQYSLNTQDLYLFRTMVGSLLAAWAGFSLF